MDNNELYKGFIKDNIIILKDYALDAKQDYLEILKKKNDKNDPDVTFYSGRKIAFYEVISLLKQQAEAFHIDFKELELDDIDPEKDLLGLENKK